jgi:hypothetical protein
LNICEQVLERRRVLYEKTTPREEIAMLNNITLLGKIYRSVVKIIGINTLQAITLEK